MPKKPAFDPSAGFEPVQDTAPAAPESSKPAFDPNLGFQAVPTTEEPSIEASAARGAAQGATMGWIDEAYGAGRSVFDDIRGVLGYGPMAEAPTPVFDDMGRVQNTEEINAPAIENYERHRDAYRAADAAAQEANPYAYGGGEFAGAIGSAFVPGLGMVKGMQVAKAAANAPRLARLTNWAAQQGGRFAPQMAQGAAIGAVTGAGYAPDAESMGDAALQSAAIGAAAPPVIAGAGKALKLGWQGAKAVGTSMLSAAGGVKSDVIKRYIANPERIRNAQSIEEIYDDVTSVVNKLGDDLDAKKITHQEAKETLAEVTRNIKEGRLENKANALEQVKLAQDSLDAAFQAQKEGMKSQASKLEAAARVEKQAATDTATDAVKAAKNQADDAFTTQKQIVQSQADPNTVNAKVADKIAMLEQRVNDGSEAAVDLLKTSGEAIKKGSLLRELRTLSNGLAKDISQNGKAAKARIDDYIENLKNNYGDEIDLPDTRQLIRNISEDVKSWDKPLGVYDDTFTQTLKKARRAFDRQLKNKSPEYKKAMQGVHDDTALLGQLSKRFGEEGQRLSRLKGIAGETATGDRKLLKRLAEKTGAELDEQIETMASAQRRLKNPAAMKKMRADLPETKAIKEAESQLTQAKRMQPPEKVGEIKRTLQSKIKVEDIKAKLPEAAELRQAEMKLAAAKRGRKPSAVRQAIKNSVAFERAKSAKARLEQAKQLMQKFAQFGEKGAEARLKAVGQGKIKASRTLRELGKMADKDFEDAVKAWADASAFERMAFNGSRNVNLWTVLGHVTVGGIIGGGPVGMALGAVLGGMADVYGPPMTKKILDQVIKAKKINEAVIKKFDLPEDVKADLLRGFQNAIINDKATENQNTEEGQQ